MSTAWPLTPYQRDILTVDTVFPDLPLAQLAGYVRIDAPLDLPRLQDCARAVADRHDALRLRIDARTMTQRPAEGIDEIEVVDFLAEPEPRVAARDWMRRATDEVLPPDGQLIRPAALVDDIESFVFYLNAHHAIADGWALSIALYQLCAEYLGTDLPIPTTSTSYLDVIEADLDYRSSARYRRDRDVLVDRFTDVTPALFARRTGTSDHTRSRRTMRFDREAAKRLRATGKSVFSVTTTALAWYLRRIHRDGDIVIGVPLLNRRAGDMLTVGNVTNMLPLLVPIDESATFDEQLTRTAAAVAEIKAHQRFPLGDLQEALREQGSGTGALFDVTYSYLTVPNGRLSVGVSEREILSSGYSLDALNIVVRELKEEGVFEVDVFYADDVFDADFAVDDLIRHVFGLLDTGLRHPGTPLRELDPLAPADVDRLRSFEGPPPAPLDESATIDRLVSARIESTPQAPALSWSDADGTVAVLTYREFGDRVAALATRLRESGLRRAEPVPLLLRRSPDLVVAVHAVLAAGGAYVPIDPDFPAARIRTILRDCAARVIVAGTEFEELATEFGIARVEPGSAHGISSTEPSASPTDLAYIIYTSGSTGVPKGVMIEHLSVVNRLTWMQRAYPITLDDVILQKTPATFDVSVWELMWWAVTGARLALLPHGGERDPRRIADAIARHRVSVLHFVPSMLGPFLDHLTENAIDATALGSLRLVFCSGEALAPALVRRFRQVFADLGLPHVRLINLYGPTEATVDVSHIELTADPVRVPIGRPIDNIALLVLDDRGRRCPLGVPGELNIAGVGVGRGYHGRDDLTAAAFIADERVPGGRRYRTGDLVRWLADGTLEYLGRLDDQVKVRGNRVTLGEIDNALRECPGVGTGIVHTRISGNATTLVAYYTGEATAATVADHLAERLPGYMVPSHFVRLAALPLTRSGKVDRKALPDPEHRRERSEAPRTDTERAVAAVWAEVLGIDAADLGVHDDFFTIGGDSILALRLRSAAEQRGLRVDIDRFFTRPTIADLAAAVAADGPAPDTGVSTVLELIPLIDRATLTGVEDAFPATALQLGMLYHSVERAESTLYKDVFRYRLRMPWRENAFRDAYRQLVRRQPALRSDFDLTGRSIPIQIVHHDVPDTLWVGPEDELDFDDYVLDAAPLFRMQVVPGDDGFELVLRFHHAVLDGWSVANLVRELLQDYLFRLGYDVEPVADTPYSPTLLAEYARAEQAAEADARSRRYWSELLDGSTATTLASTRAHEPPSPAGPVEVTAVLPGWLRRTLPDFAARHRVPLKSVLLTAHCLTLRALSGSDDITTGVVSHARPARTGGESVAGLFLNTLPTRLDPTARTWLAAIRRIARQERDGHAHRRYPLRAIIADLGRVPFETAFNYVNYHVFSGSREGGDLALTDFRIHEETNFALLVTAATDPRTDDILVRICAGRDALGRTQCEQYARLFIGTLEAMVRGPDRPIDVEAARVRDAVHLVEAAAALHPDKVAVVDDSTSWDYRTLDRAAERVALRLRADGVTTGARVAVHLPRAVESLAVVLGVLRAGAAVVPLDPSYPQARREAMIARSRPVRIVTDAAELLAADAADAVLPAPHPESVAYVLFTSGSTGEPKGVAMPHRGLANLVDWQNDSYTSARGATTLQFAPLSFDVSFQEIFSTLAGGGTMRLITEEQRRDPAALVRVVAENDIARLYLPYVALQAFAEAAQATGRYPTGLTALASSGEQLRITPEIRALAAANPGVVVENQYGPTESHVAAAFSMSDPERFPDLPPIGRPVGGATIELLDDRLRPVASGVPGEIYLGGSGLAQGYEHRPNLTAQRFVAAPGGRIRYRTGDLGLRMPDGAIVCLGRTDTQVKVRGYRVECAEVELALARIDGVVAAAVLARRLDGIDAVLEAFVVPASAAPEPEQIRSALRRTLPPHMIPARVHRVDELPLTPSGKRDDAALLRLADTTAAPTDVTPPADALVREIAALLAEFVGVEAFGADTDFFAAGGTSIGAMRVAMTLTKRFDTEIPLESFVAAPTAAGLARIVRTSGARRGFDPLVPLRGGADNDVPLFLIHPIGGNVICYVPLARRLGGTRAVYGLQAAGAEPGTTPLTSVPDLAAAYLEAIRRVRPHGPYHIAGWSFGGYVALEMARQLPEDEVDRLILLDTMALGDTPPGRISERDLILWFFGELVFYARGDLALETDFDTSATDREHLFESVLRQAVDHGILPKDSSPQLVRRLYAVFHANFEATLGYRMSPLDRDVTLLRARDGLPSGLEHAHRLAGTMFGSASNGWDRWAPRGLDIREIPGDHLSMMTEPHIAAVAEVLSELLEPAPVDGSPGRES
ncbi:amino acid adenylation domain-containing protein [Nocardia sp. NPDC004068]|uniref:amino acid adenylation domain-containing protein n=1 Tax=Nocardia sp. NPDC004068 TaxID=3364303 RepID=UPI0036762647